MTLADRHIEPSDPRRAGERSSSRVVATGLTLDQYLALPDGETSLEYDHGTVTQKVAPQGDHGSLQGEFLLRLDRVARERRLGKVFTETRFVTPGWAPVPDVSYYRKERIRLASPRRFGDFRIPPDIAVEIVSPDQSVSELLRKCLRYAALGVPVSLIVDPDDETVFDIRPGQPTRALREDDRIDLGGILPGFELTVRELFDSIVPDWLTENAGDAEPPPGDTAPARGPAEDATPSPTTPPTGADA